MRIPLSNLWRQDSTIAGGPFVLWGALLLAIKNNLDRYVATVVFHREWTPFSYLHPGEGSSILSLHGNSLTFYMTMAAIALPFVVVGVLLTLRRLRAIGLPPACVVLFFLPFLNLLFFLMLAILPSREGVAATSTAHARHGSLKRLLDRIMPRQPLGAALMSTLIVVLLTAAVVAFGTQALRDYGWGLFVGVPFMQGLLAALLFGYHRPQTYGRCLSVAMLSVMLLGCALLLFAIEGAICLVMALPLALLLAILGGSVGYAIQRRPSPLEDAPGMLMLLVIALPLLMGAEAHTAPPAPLFAVRSSVEINAPPERVWQHVVHFSELPPPDDWLFRIGIAYPQRASIAGQGVGAIRRCIFSTGPFVEPIQVWDEPHLLKFSVTSNPPPMEEWTLYRRLHPPHLDGFLVSRGGQFRLIALPNGHTLLEGTTWYQHHMWPANYWHVWSDYIIHRIHMRVLNHVKHLSED